MKIAFNKLAERITSSIEGQKARELKATEALKNATNADSAKEARHNESNARQRIKRLQKISASTEQMKKAMLKYFADHTDLLAPSDIYAFDAALQYIECAEKGTDVKDCLARWFVPFSKSLSVDAKAIKDELSKPSSSVKGSAGRWTTAPAWALEKMGAATLHKRGRKLIGVELNPEAPIIKELKKRAVIGELAES